MPIYLIDKPLGISSHEAVRQARKRLATRRVGHAGTLDPLATGLLVLLAEEATKLSPFVSGHDKRYLAWVAFGAETATLDAEGPITREAHGAAPDASAICAQLPYFLALREQLPPHYSAIKQGGVKGYQAARRGEALSLTPRPAGYREIRLLATGPLSALPRTLTPSPSGWQPSAGGITFQLPPPLGDYPGALFELGVQAGTYIRAFARDLGERLGVPSHLAGLARVAAGRLTLQQAHPLAALTPQAALPMTAALDYPQLTLDAGAAARVRQGQRPPLKLQGRAALVSEQGELVAIAEGAPGGLKLLRVWA